MLTPNRWMNLLERSPSGSRRRLHAYAAFAMLAFVIAEDFASIALFPADLYEPNGVVGWLESVFPLLGSLRSSQLIAGGFQLWTVAWLLLALIGFAETFSTLIGIVSFLVLSGMIRNCTFYFHQGMMPLYLAVTLLVVPCLVIWRPAAGIKKSETWQMAFADEVTVRACWYVIGLAYLLAGLSKLRYAGLDWIDADNFRRIVIQDTLNPMLFNFRFGLWLNKMPDAVVECLAASALFAEILFPVAWFSRWARLIMPCLGLIMHVGIILLQNVCFFDLILLQVVLIGEWWITERRAVAFKTDGIEIEQAERRRRIRAFPIYLVLCATLIWPWFTGTEWYPVTSWKMYSRLDKSGTAHFFRIMAYYEDGSVHEFRPEDWIGILRDTRYRMLVRQAESDCATFGTEIRLARFLEACKQIDDLSSDQLGISTFQVHYYQWDFRMARKTLVEPRVATIAAFARNNK